MADNGILFTWFNFGPDAKTENYIEVKNNKNQWELDCEYNGTYSDRFGLHAQE